MVKDNPNADNKRMELIFRLLKAIYPEALTQDVWFDLNENVLNAQVIFKENK